MNYLVTISTKYNITLSNDTIHTVHEEMRFNFANGEDALCFMDTASKHVEDFDGATLELVIPKEEVF